MRHAKRWVQLLDWCETFERWLLFKNTEQRVAWSSHTHYGWVFCEQLTVALLVRKLLSFYERRSSSAICKRLPIDSLPRQLNPFIFISYFLLCIPVIPQHLPSMQIRNSKTVPVKFESFFGFPMPISECWDGSQDSKLPLHASHVTLSTSIY